MPPRGILEEPERYHTGNWQIIRMEFSVMNGSIFSWIQIRRVMGVVVVMGAAAITTGWAGNAESHPALADERPMPDLGGAIGKTCRGGEHQ